MSDDPDICAWCKEPIADVRWTTEFGYAGSRQCARELDHSERIKRGKKVIDDGTKKEGGSA